MGRARDLKTFSLVNPGKTGEKCRNRIESRVDHGIFGTIQSKKLDQKLNMNRSAQVE